MPKAVNRNNRNLARGAVAQQNFVDRRIVDAFAFGHKNWLRVRQFADQHLKLIHSLPIDDDRPVGRFVFSWLKFAFLAFIQFQREYPPLPQVGDESPL